MALKNYLLAEIPGQKLEVNDQFPDFEFYLTDLGNFSLSSLPQKIKIIITLPTITDYFFAPELRNFLNSLERLQETYEDIESNIVLLTISDDPMLNKNIENIEKFKHIRSINYSLADKEIAGIEFAKTLGIYIPGANFLCYPSVYIVDENNKIIYVKYADSLLGSLNLAKINQIILSMLEPSESSYETVLYKK
ncbi:Thiol peroxidase [[Mycoplasma] cavipharyngis]|uniref:redoxin family protein n=1 Tax=[Mycoplasma] cavipharyngis TaxID=92757 RepID=UPI00370413A7